MTDGDLTLFSPEFGVMSLSDATIESKFFFQFVFCAVSLAIVWGTTLERIKFGAYVIYAIVFSTIIYPIGAHWVFGGGFLQVGDWLGTGIVGMQDFAGSTAVHLIGATGALAALLLLGARRGKYGPDGKPRAIPGHNMPLFGLGVLILWLGWFGFNPGSTLNALDGRFPEILIITNLAAAAGVLAAVDHGEAADGIDRHRHGRQRRDRRTGRDHGTVRLRRALGGADHRRGRRCDRRPRRLRHRQVIDDPVGALSAHGLAGIWGTLACGLFTAPRLAQYNAFGDPEGGLFYSGNFDQLIAQIAGFAIAFTFVFIMSFTTFWLIKKTIRPAGDAGRGGRRAGHLRARDVRIPRAVHPAGGVPGRRRPSRRHPAPAPAPRTTMAADDSRPRHRRG